MKPTTHSSSSWSLAFALALCCLACPQKTEDKPASVVKEKEPNNNAEQTQKIAHDMVLEAEISVAASERDEDWFWLPAAAKRWAYVEAIPSPGVDLALEVVTEEGEVLLRTNRAGLGGAESIPNVGLGQPRFFRVVSAKDGSGGSYQLHVRFVDAVANHEAEPNIRPAEASLALLDEWQQGILAAVDDADWFRFELPTLALASEPVAEAAAEPATATEPAAEMRFHRVAVEVEVDSTAALEMQLCDGEGKPLVRTRPGHQGHWLVRNYALPPKLSAVTLLVKPSPSTIAATNTTTAFTTTPYQLKLSLEKTDTSFESEPNNSPSQATPLFHDKAMEALLSPAGDVDYFRVDVAQPSLVNVELSALEGVDLQLLAIAPANAASKEAERVLLRSNEGKTNEAERLLDVQCESTCYFKVESVAKNQENPKAPYKIRAQVQTDSQRREKEPNNTFAQATALAMGQSVRGHVYPKGDVDFFRIDLSQMLVRKPIIATLFGLPKNNLELRLHRLDDEGKLELVQTAPTPKQNAPTTLRYSAPPRMYFLEVKDFKKRESNFQDEYQLRVDWEDSP